MPQPWETVRDALINGTHVKDAKEYLTKLTAQGESIPILVSSGHGFGDQAFPFRMERGLRDLGFQGTVRMIARLVPVTPLFGEPHQSPLRNLLKLYRAEDSFVRDSLSIDFHGSEIIFYDLPHWEKVRDSLPEHPMALAPGWGRWMEQDFGSTLWSWLNYPFTHSLTKITKSKGAAYLNTFTLFSKPGDIIQMKNRQPVEHMDSYTVGYPPLSVTPENVAHELARVRQKDAGLAETLQLAHDLQSKGKVNTEALYALHSLTKFGGPEYAMLNISWPIRKQMSL